MRDTGSLHSFAGLCTACHPTLSKVRHVIQQRTICVSCSLASLKEAEYFLLLAHDLGYLSPADHNELTELVNRTFAALDGLIKAVRKEVGPVGALWATLIAGLITALGRHLVSI